MTIRCENLTAVNVHNDTTWARVTSEKDSDFENKPEVCSQVFPDNFTPSSLSMELLAHVIVLGLAAFVLTVSWYPAGSYFSWHPTLMTVGVSILRISKVPLF